MVRRTPNICNVSHFIVFITSSNVDLQLITRNLRYLRKLTRKLRFNGYFANFYPSLERSLLNHRSLKVP